MSRSFRPLLPRVPRSGSNGATDPSSSNGGRNDDQNPSGPSKRRQNPVACESCRKRKSRCDGQRPACRACVRRGRAAECLYDAGAAETRSQAWKRRYEAADKSNNVYLEFFDVLRCRPAEEVTDIVARLRAGARIEDLLRHVQAGDLLLQMAVAPDSRFRHSMGNILVMPDLLKTPSNPYTSSIVHRIRFGSAPEPRPILGSSDLSAMYDAPYHAARMVSSVLDSAVVSNWTSVSASEEALREILRCYFTSTYIFLPFFHKDFFLQDLASGRHRFCSSLLVNSVLAAGCRSFRRLPDRFCFWDPSSLQYQFLAEARRLRELEASEKSITRVQADMVLHLEHGLNAQDKIGWALCFQAVVTAQEMGLFTAQIKHTSEPWRIVQATTSWALFAWQSLQSYHQEKPPLVTRPPDLALPTEPNAFGEIWVKYPTTNSPIPLHFSQTFRAIVEFRTIMNDIATSTNLSSDSKAVIGLDEAMIYRARLQQWYGRLPSHLMPQYLITPADFHIHMHYWLVMARLFQPLEGDENCDPPRPSQALEDSPREIVAHAKTCIRTLIRLYYSSHGSDGYDLFAILITQFIGFSALGGISVVEDDSITVEREAYEADAIICAQILHGQSHMAYLGDMVLRVLRQSLPVGVARQLLGFVNVSDVDEGTTALVARQVQAEWPIHVVAPTRSTDDRRLGNLFRAIAALSVDGDGGNSSVGGNASS